MVRMPGGDENAAARLCKIIDYIFLLLLNGVCVQYSYVCCVQQGESWDWANVSPDLYRSVKFPAKNLIAHSFT